LGFRPAEAREPLREGLALAERCGARALERRARDELVAAGARPRRRELTGVDSLTPSERRVAAMAASGMTNREIAQALFVTVKAIRFHLGNAYRKLGVSNRDDLSPVLA
jgi:DNA-binding CsgD family transcriptional regulator